MKILYVAGREQTYSRTRIVLAALRSRGLDVVAVLPPDRRFRHYPKLLWQVFRRAPQGDLVLVGFYGQLLLPLIWLLTRKPIVFDMYITTYDTMVFDRQKAKPGSFKAWVYGLSDRLSYRAARLSILDSDHVIAHFGRLFGERTDKLRRLFLAVDDAVIHPRPALEDSLVTPKERPIRVHFHGEYVPFHGVNHILRAAKLLEQENIVFQIIGKGQTYERDMALARELGLKNVEFYGPVPYDQLADFMARADMCLGIFGENERQTLVITNKVIEAIGMAKPLITSRNAPVQELLTDGESVLLVERANPQALAEAILRLANDPVLRQRLADNGYQVFAEHCAIPRLGEAFEGLFQDVLRGKAV